MARGSNFAIAVLICLVLLLSICDVPYQHIFCCCSSCSNPVYFLYLGSAVSIVFACHILEPIGTVTTQTCRLVRTWILYCSEVCTRRN
jgi:hypothetical protein